MSPKSVNKKVRNPAKGRSLPTTASLPAAEHPKPRVESKSRIENIAESPGPVSPLERLRAIVAIIESSSLTKLIYKDHDLSLTLSREPALGTGAAGPFPIASDFASLPRTVESFEQTDKNEKSDKTDKTEKLAEELDVFVVRSPFIGTFYRSSSPDSEPFSEVGRPIRRGQTLCIVEAMKLMNEIESEVDGTVIEVFVDNGKPVQYGDALLKILIQTH